MAKKQHRKTHRRRHRVHRRKVKRNPSKGGAGIGEMLLNGAITAAAAVGTSFASSFVADYIVGAGGDRAKVPMYKNIIKLALAGLSAFVLPAYVGKEKAAAIVGGVMTSLAAGIMKAAFDFDLGGSSLENVDVDALIGQTDAFDTSAQLDFAGVADISGDFDESDLIGVADLS